MGKNFIKAHYQTKVKFGLDDTYKILRRHTRDNEDQSENQRRLQLLKPKTVTYAPTGMLNGDGQNLIAFGGKSDVYSSVL